MAAHYSCCPFTTTKHVRDFVGHGTKLYFSRSHRVYMRIRQIRIVGNITSGFQEDEAYVVVTVVGPPGRRSKRARIPWVKSQGVIVMGPLNSLRCCEFSRAFSGVVSRECALAQ